MALIKRMAAVRAARENATWGAERIRGELSKIGVIFRTIMGQVFSPKLGHVFSAIVGHSFSAKLGHGDAGGTPLSRAYFRFSEPREQEETCPGRGKRPWRSERW
jgi:hypothetical protein